MKKQILVFALSAFIGLASAERVCTESEYKGRTIKKCREAGAPAAGGGSFSDSFTDPRDGQTYRTVQIGSQTWMAENLNYKTDDSYCYDDEPANCRKYGRLYTWYAAKDACPSGWHLPSRVEWEMLLKAMGGEYKDLEAKNFGAVRSYIAAGKALKSRSGWNKNGNGTDAYGFSALPAGARHDNGVFSFAGDNAYFWSATEDNSSNAYLMGLYFSYDGANLGYNYKLYARSVRCLWDIDEGRFVKGRFVKDINKVLKEVAGLQTTGKTVLGGRRGMTADSTRANAEGGIGGGDGLAGLIGGGGGGIAAKAKGTIKTPSARDIDMGAGGGSRSVADIMKVVRQRTPGLRHVYNKFLKMQPEEQPGFAGKVTLRFTIAPGGDIISISIASSTTGFGEFDNAVKNAVKRWTFSKVKFGNTTVTIPFTFSFSE